MVIGRSKLELICVYLWLNIFPRLRLLEELEGLVKGRGQFAAFPVDGRQSHFDTSPLIPLPVEAERISGMPLIEK